MAAKLKLIRERKLEPNENNRLHPAPSLSEGFEDYAGISYRDGRLAVVSQASARVWIAEIDQKARLVVDGSQAVYRIPA